MALRLSGNSSGSLDRRHNIRRHNIRRHNIRCHNIRRHNILLQHKVGAGTSLQCNQQWSDSPELTQCMLWRLVKESGTIAVGLDELSSGVVDVGLTQISFAFISLSYFRSRFQNIEIYQLFRIWLLKYCTQGINLHVTM